MRLAEHISNMAHLVLENQEKYRDKEQREDTASDRLSKDWLRRVPRPQGAVCP